MALEEGVEMELVSDRIGELRAQKEALEATLVNLAEPDDEAEEEELLKQLELLPDLTEKLRSASPQIKRQVFHAFDLQIAFDGFSLKASQEALTISAN